MIDAHMHFWDPGRGDYGWLTPEALPSLFRVFQPDDIAETLADLGIDGVIAVQAAPTEAETRYLFALARGHRVIRGVVGWVDFDAADAPARIDALVAEGEGLLRALRPMLQDLADVDWVARPKLDAAFDRMVAHDLAFEALVRVEHLPALLRRIERTPRLRVMVDHGAKPRIGDDAFDAWTAAMKPLADIPSVFCKVSGLLTEAGDRAHDAVDRYVRWLLQAFGADRLVWGSDWPVLTLAADYRDWHDRARRLLDDPRVFGLNAEAFYRLPPSHPILILSPLDNVAVALRTVTAGEAIGYDIVMRETVGFGFKIATTGIENGGKVLKYGVPIGSASRDIAAGESVHMHNMQSDYTATHTRELKDDRS